VRTPGVRKKNIGRRQNRKTAQDTRETRLELPEQSTARNRRGKKKHRGKRREGRNIMAGEKKKRADALTKKTKSCQKKGGGRPKEKKRGVGRHPASGKKKKREAETASTDSTP